MPRPAELLSCNLRKQFGITTAEYLIVALALAAALFLPVTGGQSVIDLLIAAFKTNHSGYMWGMSVPL